MHRSTIISKDIDKKLDRLIEQKILEILGDPDYGLDLRSDFKAEILRRLRSKTKHTPHQEVLKKFG